MPSSQRNPTSWAEYEARASPSGSLSSSPLGEEQALLDDGGDDDVDPPYFAGRRR
jgi:hypothetical protein